MLVESILKGWGFFVVMEWEYSKIIILKFIIVFCLIEWIGICDVDNILFDMLIIDVISDLE